MNKAHQPMKMRGKNGPLGKVTLDVFTSKIEGVYSVEIFKKEWVEEILCSIELK